MAGDSDIGRMFGEAAQRQHAELMAARNRPFVLPPLTKIFEPGLEAAYRDCVTPLDLVESLRLSSREIAVTQIHRELRSGRLRAICEEAHIAVGNVIDRLSWVRLASFVWNLDAPSTDADFWETGYFEISIPANEVGYAEQGKFTLFAVRFPLISSAVQAPVAPDITGEATPTDRVSVSKRELDKWHDVFKVVHPNAAEALAIRSAAAMFPDNHVPRQWVRELRGPQKRGKPAIRHE